MFATRDSFRYFLGMPKRLLLTETAWLPGWTKPIREGADAPVLTEAQREGAEDVKAYGLDEDVYLAVVPADLGEGGTVNVNRRIYPAERFALENASLDGRIRAGEFSPMEAEHPEALATINVAARLLEITLTTPGGDSITVEAGDDGKFVLPEGWKNRKVARASGKVAFLRTSEGQNAYVLYRAGMPIGVSSVSFGLPVPHVIDDDSEYLEANPGFKGERVTIIEDQDLVRYDVVANPSARTYFHNEQARRAYESLAESAQLPPLTEPAEEAAEDPMPKNIAELRAKFPELAAEIEAEAKKAALESNAAIARVAKMDEAEAKRLLSVAEALKGKDADVADGDELAEKVAGMVETAMGPVRQRVAALEAETKAAKQAREAAEAEAKQLREAEAKRQQAEALETAFTEALGTIHTNLRPLVEAQVRKGIDGGRLTAETVAEAVKDAAEFAAKVSEATAKPATEGAAPDADDKGAAGDGDEEAPAVPSFGESIFGQGFLSSLSLN